MSEFRWVESFEPISDDKSRFVRDLQYRHWLPYIGAHGDVILDRHNWTDWQTVSQVVSA